MKTYSSPKRQRPSFTCIETFSEFKEESPPPIKTKINSFGPLTSPIKVTPCSPATPSKKLKQTFFDLGEKTLKHCKECGMHWDPSFDTNRHTSFHNSYNRCQMASTYTKSLYYKDKKTFSNGDIILTYASPLKYPKHLRILIDRVNSSLMGACDLSDDLFNECDCILYIREAMVVGILLLRNSLYTSKHILKSVYSDSAVPALQSITTFIGVERIYVQPLHRRQGIARKMLDYLIYKNKTRRTIAFSPTTTQGEGLGRSVFGDDFLIYL